MLCKKIRFESFGALNLKYVCLPFTMYIFIICFALFHLKMDAKFPSLLPFIKIAFISLVFTSIKLTQFLKQNLKTYIF